MNSPVLMVVHQRLSYPGRVAEKLMALGYPLDIRCPNIGQSLPEDLDPYAAVFMFGGPMCALDCHIPAIRRELDWMPDVLDSGKPFVGICLGAQMLARVLGARVWPHPEGRVEIGYTPIQPTDAGADLFPQPIKMFQWHRDGFDLPSGAELLATNENFPQQAIRYGNAYGFQFHPEVTPEIMQRWSVGGGHMLHMPGAQSREDQLAEYPVADPVIARWTDRLLAYVMGEDAAKLSEKTSDTVEMAA
jgi:GMP synthase (glutamine-hydrolysing)